MAFPKGESPVRESIFGQPLENPGVQDDRLRLNPVSGKISYAGFVQLGDKMKDPPCPALRVIIVR